MAAKRAWYIVSMDVFHRLTVLSILGVSAFTLGGFIMQSYTNHKTREDGKYFTFPLLHETMTKAEQEKLRIEKEKAEAAAAAAAAEQQ
ncbi:hypothetical protein B0I72DRAFT_137914 [Yarrowia lipolytica]|nr:hypothetical protein BKA91DRAFT_134496 [Yarrowia lipolytica]KAE8174735.1 hypothetical protein BKA90DRAFT_133352 [Yarrowia lipolytica]KAJ8056044.1 hypothetical protein LXG23DRAFT_57576 [Yarrowia lipolytica]QNQ00578.1 Hypothetical protein YALI2_F00123g [Yarrowia lipolytica]RDW24495.1 hypothetical protein B0I71DRAFT_134210 [Yarrowia lipolytica]